MFYKEWDTCEEICCKRETLIVNFAWNYTQVCECKELMADRETQKHVISIKEETELSLNDTRGLLWSELCFMCERSDSWI